MADRAAPARSIPVTTRDQVIQGRVRGLEGVRRVSAKLGVSVAAAPFTGIGVASLTEPDLMVEIEAIAVLD